METVVKGIVGDLTRPDTLLAAVVSAHLFEARRHVRGTAFAADFVVVFLVLKNLLGI